MLFLEQISVLSRTFPFLSFLSVPSTNLSCTKSQASPESDDPPPPSPPAACLSLLSQARRGRRADPGQSSTGGAGAFCRDADRLVVCGLFRPWINRGVSAAGAVVGTKFGENEACANVCRSLRRLACARHTSLQPCSVHAHRHRHTSNHF